MRGIDLTSGMRIFRISYGKSPSNREIGNTLATHQFLHTTMDTVSFYTFGSGENKVIVDDVRVVRGSPTVTCGYGLKKVRFRMKFLQPLLRLVQLMGARTKDFCADGKFMLTIISFKVDRKCVMDCNKQCSDTCHKPFDPKSCIDKCKNVKHFYHPQRIDVFTCLALCPAGYEPRTETIHGETQTVCRKCRPGHHKSSSGR